jgi:hypothetical protein
VLLVSGFIAMDRGALDHPLLKDADRFRAWFWLIANAAWKPTRTRIKGTMVEIDRGDLTFSVRFLADNWGWSKSRVDRFLSDLRDEGMIETRSKIGTTAGHVAGQGQSIITICNYDKYQSSNDADRDNGDAENGTTAGQRRDNSGTNKNKGTREQDNTNTSGRAHVLRDDWHPVPFGPDTKSHAQIQGWPPGEFETQLEHFTSHHRSKGSKFKDWQDAWSTWVLNSRKWNSGNGNSRSNAGSYPARNGGKPKDGAIAACDRRLGLDGGIGEQPRHDHSSGSGDRGRALAPARTLL